MLAGVVSDSGRSLRTLRKCSDKPWIFPLVMECATAGGASLFPRPGVIMARYMNDMAPLRCFGST